MPRRVLLVSTTTGYQTKSFGEAAERLGIELVFATDRCRQLDDPWRDGAVPVRFHEEEAAVGAIADASRSDPIQGVLALGDRPARIAALAADALRVPGHSVGAAEISRNKLATRQCLAAAGLATPWFLGVRLDGDPRALLPELSFPCVVKPLALSGSRGVIRANDETEFLAAFARLRRLLTEASVRAMCEPLNETIVVEGFVPGRELALEGLVRRGRLRTLALFDKPDPLDGPFFEETIYVTPSALPALRQQAIEEVVGRAIAAMGLWHGPVHAECRVAEDRAGGAGITTTVLEVAPRPVGGLCARALRFQDDAGGSISLEELLLRHAVGDPIEHYLRESEASGVMMIPIPRRGIYRRAEGVTAARTLPGVEDIRITAKPDQMLVPLPEGASYLGFIFAKGNEPAEVDRALRAAHAQLRFVIDREITVAKD